MQPGSVAFSRACLSINFCRDGQCVISRVVPTSRPVRQAGQFGHQFQGARGAVELARLEYSRRVLIAALGFHSDGLHARWQPLPHSSPVCG